MKRKELDKRLTQLLDRIDGELAEIRDGLIEVDHRAAAAARSTHRTMADVGAIDRRLRTVESMHNADDSHYSRRADS